MDGPLVLDQELGNALFAPPDVVVENHADRPPGTADVRHSTGAKNVGFVRDAEVYAGDANKKGAQAGRPSVGRWQGRNHLRGTQSRTSSNSKRATPHSRSEEHTSELQSLMRISYDVFCLKKQKTKKK